MARGRASSSVSGGGLQSKKTACGNCKQRHLRCDNGIPSCSRCSEAGLHCGKPLNVRFRHDANPSVSIGKDNGERFARNQKWVNIPSRMTFVDETLDTIAVYDVPVSQPERDSLDIINPNTRSTPVFTAISPKRRTISQAEEDLPRLARIVSTSSDAECPSQISSTTNWTELAHSSYPNTSTSQAAAACSYPSPLIAGSVSDPLRRSLLTNHTEAELLQYFVENLATSFDLTDSSRHFRLVVPQHAVTDPVLFNAVCAVSARHLARVAGGDSLAAETYHDRCLQHLIPILSDEVAVFDENLLAATIILRYLEELDVPMSGTSEESLATHLIGTSVFVAAQEGFAFHGGLRLSAFWIALRQEIHIAFIQQRPVIQFQRASDDEIAFGSSEEDIWANRIVLYCARVITHCFGSEHERRNVQRYAALLQEVDLWHAQAPRSFSPFFRCEAGADSNNNMNNVFPVIVYCSDAVVTGVQHYHLARILLLSHDPAIPLLGPRRTATLKKVDQSICKHVRELCGLATSNARASPNFVTASMAIAMTGDKFTDLNEQQECLRILQITEQIHGWSTQTAQQDLREAWG